MTVPSSRLRTLVEPPAPSPKDNGRYVLYWMTSSRRTSSNFALQYAVEEANRQQLPLVVLEALRCGYRWASVRHHRFILEGMRDNAEVGVASDAVWLHYVEDAAGHGAGLLEALAEHATLVVADDNPGFFLPRMLGAAASKLTTRLVAVDSVGVYPMRQADKTYKRAVDFRRHLQRTLIPHLEHFPDEDPLRALECRGGADLVAAVLDAYPALSPDRIDDLDQTLAGLPIDTQVGPGSIEGGPVAGMARAQAFVERRIDRFLDDRMLGLDHGSSGLSAYLHYGHVSAAWIVEALLTKEGWTPDEVGKAKGAREGWWGLSTETEAFFDQLITWRELGYNMAWREPDYRTYESLPGWALDSLAAHADDPRPELYDLETLDAAATHDPVWNAAQRELVQTGLMHTYIRMLWGKKILEWSPSPQTALTRMIELNNRYALDGRDPNSYTGIHWVLGRYDRAWQERPIYGKVRYMTSDSTRRKMKLEPYLERFGPG